jgi:hypothetical protein
VTTPAGERWRCEVCQRLYETWVEAEAHAAQDLTAVSGRLPPPPTRT